jgi:hypothetical protein
MSEAVHSLSAKALRSFAAIGHRVNRKTTERKKSGTGKRLLFDERFNNLDDLILLPSRQLGNGLKRSADLTAPPPIGWTGLVQG